MATVCLKWGLSELTCVSVKYTSDFEDLHKNIVKYLANNFMLTTYFDNILDILGEMKHINSTYFFLILNI